jgi:hypothetical protein
LLLAGCLLLGACGGVGEEGTGVQPVTISVGVLKGLDDSSVTVNGVNYARADAAVVDGFDKSLGAESLRLGMWLEVQGTIDASGERGAARTIRVRPAARGVVSASTNDAGGPAVTVLDANVRLGNGTVLEGVASAAGLAAGDVVEVHGPLAGAAGDVSASRVEKMAQPPTPQQPFELRGRVSQLDPMARTLTVGRRAVSYASAAVALRSALGNGLIVRVSAAAPPVAGQPWVVERLVADQPLPDNLGFLYAEGIVEDLQTGPLFLLEGLGVDAVRANKKGAITANGLRVAVVGALVGGTLQAKSVAVIEPGEPVVFTLSGVVTDFVSAADFRLRGVVIDASGASYVAPASPGGLANAVRLRVKGTMLGRKLIATQVEDLH